LAVGLLMLSPLTLVAARIVGSAILLFTWRRQPLFKVTLNLAAFTAETVIAAVMFRLVYQPGDAASPLMWAWLTVSIMVGLVIGGSLIATAISFFEGEWVKRVRREFSHSYLFYLPGAILGASAIVPMLVEPWLVLVVLIPAPMMWLLLRSHGSLMHRYSDLSHAFDFSSEIGSATHLHEIAETAVGQIAEQLRAGSVALVIWDEGAGDLRTAHGDSALLSLMPATAHDQDWDLGDTSTRHVFATGTDALSQQLRDLGFSQAILVELLSDDEPIGVVAVADRQGAASRFSADDESRLGNIVEQLAIAVRKVQLHVQIQHDATHDRLTGLLNRHYLEAWVGQVVDDEPAAVLMIDLDRFKEVNDTLGHHAGDDLLKEVATRLGRCLEDDDLPARFGGDEFAVFAPRVGEHEASLLAEKISQALEEPFALGESTVAVAASIGIAVSPEHGQTSELLLRRADLAMYDAKRRHIRSSVYNPGLDSTDSIRLAMLGDLREALRDGALDVQFQPKQELRTGSVVGVEALVRWTHPTHGAVSPEVFVSLAEQAGLIEELTDHILTTALAAAADWRRQDLDLTVAVNLSPLSLINEQLPGKVQQHLETANVPPAQLILEITEQSVIVDTPRTMRILSQLHDIGVQISIDDFGTGHSSLTNLRRMPITELKVDRSFVTEMLVERNDEVIVRSTIDLGHNLGFTVVAEGVETVDVLDQLQTLGCDVAQGYGICRPLPYDKLTRWLQRPHSQTTTYLETQPHRAETSLTVGPSPRR